MDEIDSVIGEIKRKAEVTGDEETLKQLRKVSYI